MPGLAGDHEILVVDNASTDGTPGMLAGEFPDVQLIRRPSNEGVSARNHALARASGRYVMLIDDDSYPLDDAAARALAWMEASPRCGAVVGRVVLPEGGLEASALPGVIINCAVVLRKSALDQVGYFPREFFRQAEEYDLSFRLWDAGYTIERFEDLVYRHEKVGGNRWPAWIHRLDLRNNLILIERYLPPELRRIYRRDWTQRYFLLARHAGHAWAARRGWLQAQAWRMRYATLAPRRTLRPEAVEAVFQGEAQSRAIAAWARAQAVRRVAVADFSKNVYATWQGCRAAGLHIEALWDAHPAFTGQSYRRRPIVGEPPAVDGVVLSNINPAQIEKRLAALRASFPGPILTLWQPVYLKDSPRITVPPGPEPRLPTITPLAQAG